MSTKQLVNVNQRWERNRGKEVFVIKQVWRRDKEVFLRSTTTRDQHIISFANLRRFYTLLPPTSPSGEMEDAA